MSSRRNAYIQYFEKEIQLLIKTFFFLWCHFCPDGVCWSFWQQPFPIFHPAILQHHDDHQYNFTAWKTLANKSFGHCPNYLYQPHQPLTFFFFFIFFLFSNIWRLKLLHIELFSSQGPTVSEDRQLQFDLAPSCIKYNSKIQF